MGLAHSPRIITNELTLYLDAANQKSYPDYNIVSYSQDYTNAYWTKTGTNFLGVTTQLAPDGTNTATTVTDNNTTYSNLSRTIAVPNDGATYNISIYIKKTTGGTSPTCGFNCGFDTGGTSVSFTPRFNTDLGTSNYSGTITSENNNYWRWSFTVTNNNSGNTNMYVQFFPATGPYVAPIVNNDTATTTGSKTIWGLQVTKGTDVLSYNMTVASRYTTWYDLSGQGNTSTIYNFPSFTSSTNANLQFDGTLGYAEVPSNIVIPDIGAFSVGFVYQLTAEGRGGIFNRYESTPFNGFSLGQGASSSWTATISSAATYTGITATFTYPTFNTWYFDCVTFNGSDTLIGYRNGSLHTTATGSAISNLSTQGVRTNFRIAKRANTVGDNLPCKVGIVSVYSRALTAAEVAQNYYAVRKRFGI